MDRAEHSHPEGFKREQEKAEQEMKRLAEIGQKQEEVRIRVLQVGEMNKRETALANARKVAVKQLGHERKNAERAMNELPTRADSRWPKQRKRGRQDCHNRVTGGHRRTTQIFLEPVSCKPPRKYGLLKDV